MKAVMLIYFLKALFTDVVARVWNEGDVTLLSNQRTEWVWSGDVRSNPPDFNILRTNKRV